MDHGDNPCWGGCKSYQHDLEYLLHVLGSPSLSSSTTSSSSSSTAAAAQISSTTMMHMTTSSESTAIATDQSRVASANSITIDAASAASSSSAIHDNNDGKNGSLFVNLNPLSKRASSPFHFSTPEEEHSSLFHRIHSKLILYHDDQYIVINKPPDLRMDGPYKATVHKLLLYLFPPPSLVLLSFGARKNTDCNSFEYRSNSNSTLGNGNENDEQYPATSILQKQQYHNQLLHSIYPLSSHSSLPDDPFRLVHQLDYATSGVLLIGKTRKATAVACKAFEERKTIKKYVAVVTNNHSNFLNSRSASTTTPTSDDSPPLGQEFFDNIPILNSSSLNAWSDGSLELQYRKKRQRETNTVKYLPIHSVFDKWRSILIRKKKEREVKGEDDTTTTPRSQSRDSHVNDVRPTALPPPLPIPKVTLTCEEEEELLSLGTSWKSVKSNILALGGEGGGRGGGEGSDNVKNKWIDIIETMAMEYNQSLGVYYAEQKLLVDGNEDNGNKVSTPSSSQPSLPPMFRISSADDRVNNKNNTSEDDDCNNTFYICAPIGEIKGRFHVIVDPSISLSERDREMISMESNVGGVGSTTTALPPLRPALTKCTVLTRGYYSSSSSSSHGSNDKQRRIPVAKVLLQPWTGRRHQLRVHLANIVGCPILGDVAYDGSGDVADPTAPDKNNSHESRIANNDKERRLECKRMCLHAKELAIPLIGGVSRTFIASDPFVFEEERLVIL